MKLSVAIITYNQERFIEQAIESVLAQRVNFQSEVVIGEDCSTDGTRGVLLEFQRRFPGRIKLCLRERNIGASQNLEATLAACRGQYLAILEGDDYWTCTDKMQKQVDFLDSHPDSAICCHRVRYLDEVGSAEYDVFPPLPAGAYTIKDLLKWNFVMTCSAVLRRDVSGPLPPCFSTMKVGDWPRFILAARHGNIELLDEIMAVYRVHPASMWSSLSRGARVIESARMLRALDEHLGFQYTNAIQQSIAAGYLDLALRARQNHNRLQTARCLIDCIWNGGLHLPAALRTLAGLTLYSLIGSRYAVLSRAKSEKK